MLNISCTAEINLTCEYFFLVTIMVFQPEQLNILPVNFLTNASFLLGSALALGGSSELDKIKISLSVASSNNLLS